MTASVITFFRILLTLSVIAFFGHHYILNLFLILVIPLIFILDAVDRIIVRNDNETSKLSKILDTFADRIVENTFWIYFTTISHIPLWMPITVITRGIITDTFQHAFGTYPKRRWTYAIKHSRISCALYGTMKMLTFIFLACSAVFRTSELETASFILASFTIGFCLFRGLPSFFMLTKITEKNTIV